MTQITLLYSQKLIITKAWKLELDNCSLFLLSVHLRNMDAQSVFALECLFAMVTTVAEVTREVYTFNVVPKVVQMQILLSTQGALVA